MYIEKQKKSRENPGILYCLAGHNRMLLCRVPGLMQKDSRNYRFIIFRH